MGDAGRARRSSRGRRSRCRSRRAARAAAGGSRSHRSRAFVGRAHHAICGMPKRNAGASSARRAAVPSATGRSATIREPVGDVGARDAPHVVEHDGERLDDVAVGVDHGVMELHRGSEPPRCSSSRPNETRPARALNTPPVDLAEEREVWHDAAVRGDVAAASAVLRRRRHGVKSATHDRDVLVPSIGGTASVGGRRSRPVRIDKPARPRASQTSSNQGEMLLAYQALSSSSHSGSTSIVAWRIARPIGSSPDWIVHRAIQPPSGKCSTVSGSLRVRERIHHARRVRRVMATMAW